MTVQAGSVLGRSSGDCRRGKGHQHPQTIAPWNAWACRTPLFCSLFPLLELFLMFLSS